MSPHWKVPHKPSPGIPTHPPPPAWPLAQKAEALSRLLSLLSESHPTPSPVYRAQLQPQRGLMEFPWGLSCSRSLLSSCLQPSLECGGDLDRGHWEASATTLCRRWGLKLGWSWGGLFNSSVYRGPYPALPQATSPSWSLPAPIL